MANGKRVKEPRKADRVERTERPERVKRRKKHFLRIHMWLSYLLAFLEKDTGTIPKDIGDKVLIMNNMYITSMYMTSIIQFVDLGINAPIGLIGELNNALRLSKCPAVLDYTAKCSRLITNTKDIGLNSRVQSWENQLDDKNLRESDQIRYARQLFTFDEAKSGKTMYTSREFLQIRAKNASTLRTAEKIVSDTLTQMGVEFLPVYSSMEDILPYVSMLTHRTGKSISNIPSMVQSVTTLAQMLPNTGGISSLEDPKATYLGVNLLNNSLHSFNFLDVTVARNLYIVAPSGWGKTVIADNIANSLLEMGQKGLYMDIKGNEFTHKAEVTGGSIVSLRPSSTWYLNQYVWKKDEVTDRDHIGYANSRLNFCISSILTLSGALETEDERAANLFISDCLNAIYVSMGVMKTNELTWYKTESLNPYVIYDKMCDYLSASVRAKYSVAQKVVDNLREYMHPSGSKSHLFTNALNTGELMKSTVIVFDYGMLQVTEKELDKKLFKLNFDTMRKINSEFSTYNYERDIPFFKILEESQMVISNKAIAQGYIEEYTLRRSQRQTTMMLGNSIQALIDNELSKPLMENTTGYLIGNLAKAARDVAVREFELEEYLPSLSMLGSSEEYDRSFLFVNKMVREYDAPILKVIMDTSNMNQYSITKPKKGSAR